MESSDASQDRAFPRPVLRLFIAMIRHPMTTLLTGMGLVLGGTLELVEELVADFDSIVAAYHGIILLGVVTALRGFADFVEGIERLSKNAAENPSAPPIDNRRSASSA